LSRPLLARAGLRAARELALTGGDDYELLFTVPARLEARLARLTRGWPLPVTRLGTVRRGKGLRWTLDGAPFRFRDRTFQHFRQARG
jgi:thiamine-monophosphate kinase